MTLLEPEHVRHLIATRWPELLPLHVERVAEGGEFATFLVDDALIFRFAPGAAAAATLAREIAMLARLGPTLPIAAPAYRYVAQEDESYPFPFAGYSKLPGVSGERVRPEHAHQPAIATQMGSTLSALHSFSANIARDLGVPTAPPLDALALVRRATAYRDVLRQGIPDALTTEMQAYLDGTATLPAAMPYVPVLCHADLKGEHILLTEDGSRHAGILDWSDAQLADAALDFAGLAIWLGPAFVAQALAGYTAPHAGQLFEWAIFVARCSALEQVGMALAGVSNAPLPLVLTQLRWAFSSA